MEHLSETIIARNETRILSGRETLSIPYLAVVARLSRERRRGSLGRDCHGHRERKTFPLSQIMLMSARCFSNCQLFRLIPLLFGRVILGTPRLGNNSPALEFAQSLTDSAYCCSRPRGFPLKSAGIFVRPAPLCDISSTFNSFCSVKVVCNCCHFSERVSN